MVERNSSPCCKPNDPVCISVNRIFDSARDKDCLEDLRVHLCDCAQEIVDHATAVRCRGVDVICTRITLEEVPFNRGFFQVTIRYFFCVKLEVCVSSGRSMEVEGLAACDKRIILFGSEKDVSVFESDPMNNEFCPKPECLKCDTRPELPLVVVEVAKPICLDTKLVERCRPFGHCCMGADSIPDGLRERFNGNFVDGIGTNNVYVTIGLFSVIRMERQVQLMLPAAQLVLPERDSTPCGTADPCSVFGKMSFPTDQFIPFPEPQRPRE